MDSAIKKVISTWPSFHELFQQYQIVFTYKTNIWLCDIFFSVLTKFLEFWPWVTKKAYAQGKKKFVKLRWWCHIFKFVLALYSSSPSDLQFELLSVRVLLLLHCNCWTDLQYTKIITSRLIQFWFGWSRNYQLTWFLRIYSQPTCRL